MGDRACGSLSEAFIPICIPPNGIWCLVIGGEKSPEESFLPYSMPQVFDSMNGIGKFLSADRKRGRDRTSQDPVSSYVPRFSSRKKPKNDIARGSPDRNPTCMARMDSI
jgi:hypothetical protein